MQIEVARKRFTVEEYYRMAETGILTASDRVELIEGEIVEMSPIGDRHMNAVNRATMIFARGVGDKAVVSIQNPAHMDRHNEPQPDVVLIRPREGFYGKGTPDPDDVLLLIEVSDSTLSFDLKVKLPVYARTGIREVWIVDLQKDLIHVHRKPTKATYGSIEIRGRGELISPQAFPDFLIDAGDLMG
jgi:Uma2 family endonuclease